jgi:hypothetical protein
VAHTGSAHLSWRAALRRQLCRSENAPSSSDLTHENACHWQWPRPMPSAAEYCICQVFAVNALQEVQPELTELHIFTSSYLAKLASPCPPPRRPTQQRRRQIGSFTNWLVNNPGIFALLQCLPGEFALIKRQTTVSASTVGRRSCQGRLELASSAYLILHVYSTFRNGKF